MNNNQGNKRKQGTTRMTMLRGGFITALMGIAIIGISACSTQIPANRTQTPPSSPMAQDSPSAKSTVVSNVPKPLEEVCHFSENIYDMAKLNDWGKAMADLSRLKKAVEGLKTDPATTKIDTVEVASTLSKLENAVSRKDRSTAMQSSNRITMIAAKLTASFKPQVPAEVTLLDYYGRELEIWAAANDQTKLNSVAKDIRQTWDKLLPTIESHGGSVEAKTFGVLVEKIEKAKTPNDFAQLATPILDEVDNLEKVFTK